jgi:hypothetical protein
MQSFSWFMCSCESGFHKREDRKESSWASSRQEFDTIYLPQSSNGQARRCQTEMDKIALKYQKIKVALAYISDKASKSGLRKGRTARIQHSCLPFLPFYVYAWEFVKWAGLVMILIHHIGTGQWPVGTLCLAYLAKENKP